VRALLLFVTLLLSACEQHAAVPEPTLTIKAFQVGAAVEKGQREFHGRVVPADLTRVAFRIPGKIEQLSIQPGDRVEAGQVIARIENSIQQQVLADARAQYQLSQRQLERAEELFSKGALTPAQNDELKAAFRLARANLELARARQSYTVVQAPFDGIVADVNKELFEAVAPGETVVTLYRDSRTDVLVNVPDGLPAQMNQATDSAAFDIRVYFPDGEQGYPMAYLKHSTARDPKTQAFQIWLTMPVSQGRFPPGTQATVAVDLGKAGFTLESGLAVPVTALEAGAQPGEFQVWRYRDGTVNPVPVTVGPITQEGVLVTDGLKAGEIVAVSGLARLVPGQAVKLYQQDEGR
jgi:RND family efflux transporter MFP subunit